MTGAHWDFVLAAYAISAVVLVGLVVRTWIDMRRQKAVLDDLEARGFVRRRPSAPAAPPEARPAAEAPS